MRPGGQDGACTRLLQWPRPSPRGLSAPWPPLGSQHSGIDRLPALAVCAVDAARVAGHGGHVIQVGHPAGHVELCAGSPSRLQALAPGHGVGLGQVHVRLLGLVHLAFVGEQDLGLRAGGEDRGAGEPHHRSQERPSLSGQYGWQTGRKGANGC